MSRKLLLNYQGDNYIVTVARRVGRQIPQELFAQIVSLLESENLVAAPPAVVLPNPPFKKCSVCHARMDVPTAHFFACERDGWWDLRWNCPSRCDDPDLLMDESWPDVLLIDWPWPDGMPISVVDVRAAGFTIVDQEKNE